MDSWECQNILLSNKSKIPNIVYSAAIYIMGSVCVCAGYF